jgi:4-carboxymuconolactone decarboxylase
MPVVPRIAPLDPAEFSAEQARLVGDWTHLNFSKVLVRNPGMYGTFVPWLARLITETGFPARDRQIACLRLLALCGDSYEQTHHIVISRKCGLSDAVIDAARAGGGECLSDWDHTVIAAVEQLYRNQTIDDATWTALAEGYDEPQLIEFVCLAGCYQTMALLTKSLAIPLEADLESFNALRDYAD